MQLGTQSNIKIQSENLINKIQNSPISGSSYLGPFGFQAPCPDGSQNLLPSYSVLPPSIVNERVDDIPLLTAILLKLDIPNIVDKLYTPHGNHEGLSDG